MWCWWVQALDCFCQIKDRAKGRRRAHTQTERERRTVWLVFILHRSPWIYGFLPSFLLRCRNPFWKQKHRLNCHFIRLGLKGTLKSRIIYLRCWLMSQDMIPTCHLQHINDAMWSCCTATLPKEESMLRTCMCNGSKVFSVVQICSTMAILLCHTEL